MDLTTHCPQCATAFLVSEDQLELAQGWVRCGVCQEVFLALAHTAAPIAPVASTTVSREPILQRQETIAADVPNAIAEAPLADTTAYRAATGPARAQAAPEVAKARYRGAALGAIFLLLALLATQAGFDALRSLADAQPKLALWLQSLCPLNDCALRQSSALGIDDSSLTSAGANIFHVKAMISNRSGLTLEAPSLALTLTDAADEVLARKIYTAREWAKNAEILQGSSAMPMDLWIRWDSTTSRVAGYRLQAFYP